jgi:hypothetical protein
MFGNVYWLIPLFVHFCPDLATAITAIILIVGVLKVKTVRRKDPFMSETEMVKMIKLSS